MEGADDKIAVLRASEKLLGIRQSFFFQQHRVNMAFKVIHGDQRLPHSERQSFGVADADQQRSRQARTLRDGQSINADVIDLGCFQCCTHHGDDVT